MHIDLGRREADAGSVVQGLEHVIDQALHTGIETGDRLGASAQPRIGKLKNRSQRHEHLEWGWG